jgi:DNA-binding NarL/FixJ family response regulator
MGIKTSAGLPCIVLGADSPVTHRRIAVALADQNPSPSHRVEAPSGTADHPGTDPPVVIILVCDVDLPREMATLRRLRRNMRDDPIVVLSSTTTGPSVRRALDAGADAFVFEPELESTLAPAIRAVTSGQSVVPRKVRASIERPALSHRERQVLAFVSRGLTNAQIAERLFLSESTIKSHLSSIFGKFGVRSRREAAALFRDLERARGGRLVGVGRRE